MSVLRSHFRLCLAALLFVASLAVYLRTLSPTVLDSNGGELQYAAFALHIPHPTGYPFYLLLGKLLTFLPFGDIAYRVNLISALGAAGAVTLIYVAARELIGTLYANQFIQREEKGGVPQVVIEIVPAVAALLLALSADLWQAATVAEVHGLNSLFVALVLLAIVRASSSRGERLRGSGVNFPVIVLWLIFGLSLTHHRLMIWFLPGLILMMILWCRRLALNRTTLLSSVALFVVPLSLYLYFPLRAWQLFNTVPARADLWPLPGAVLRGLITPYYSGNNLGGFLDLVTGRGFSGDLGFGNAEQLALRLRYGWDLSLSQFGVLGALLAAVGLVVIIRRQPILGLALGLPWGLIFVFNQQYTHGQIWYYYLPTFVIASLALAIGLAAVMGGAVNLAGELKAGRFRALVLGLGMLATIGWPVYQLVAEFPKQDRSRDVGGRVYAEAVLGQPLKKDAVLMGCWDAVTPLRYLQFAESWRPDLWILHAEPSWPDVQAAAAKVLAGGGQVVLLQCGETGTYPLPFGFAVTPVYLPLPTLPERLTNSGVTFGGKVKLEGYRLTSEGRQVDLTLYWRVLDGFGQDYKVFVHAVEAGSGRRWTQLDRPPVSPFYPTSRWRAGDLLEDSYTLFMPAEAPGDEYRLLVGFYATDGGQRLTAVGEGVNSNGDSLELVVAIP